MRSCELPTAPAPKRHASHIAEPLMPGIPFAAATGFHRRHAALCPPPRPWKGAGRRESLHCPWHARPPNMIGVGRYTTTTSWVCKQQSPIMLSFCYLRPTRARGASYADRRPAQGAHGRFRRGELQANCRNFRSACPIHQRRDAQVDRPSRARSGQLWSEYSRLAQSRADSGVDFNRWRRLTTRFWPI